MSQSSPYLFEISAIAGYAWDSNALFSKLLFHLNIFLEDI